MIDKLKFLMALAAIAVTLPAAAQDASEDQPAESPAEQPAADENGAGEDATEPPQEGADAPPAADGNDSGAAGLSMGEEDGPESGPGSTYIAEEFGDWQMRCVRTEDGDDPCQLYQLLRDQDDNSVAEISLFGLPDGQEAAAGATIITPLETLLTQQLRLAVDGAQPKRYPFTWCSQIGCFARIGFTEAEVNAFRRGASATLTIVPVAAPDEQVVLDISLSGFTAGFEAVNERNGN